MHSYVAADIEAVRAQCVSTGVLEDTADAVEVAGNPRIAEADGTFGTEPFAEKSTTADFCAIEREGIGARIPEAALSAIQIAPKARAVHTHFAERNEVSIHNNGTAYRGLVRGKRDAIRILEARVRTVEHPTDVGALQTHCAGSPKPITQ